MMRLPQKLGVAVLVAALPLASTTARAQTGGGDQGTFQVLIGGRPVGSEEFTIQETGAGENTEIVASGRVSLRLPTGSLELSPRLRTTGFQAQPVSYQVDIGGSSPQKIVGTLGNGRFSARIVTQTGEQLREYVAANGGVVLDEGLAHHYYFIARRLRDGRVPILVPRENRQVMATVRSRGEERVQIGSKTVPLFRLVVVPDGGEERHVWVDALSRVIKVEIPARDYSAVRTAVPD
ncbi:MAG: hypothetical protein KY464_10710 [Gemmatimonadetes bacterium]|nr:hypothetical protein [Gemmatimonadota bacterium]